MGRWIWHGKRSHRRLLGLALLAALGRSTVPVEAQATARLTLLVRDADGQPLPNVGLSVYVPHAPAPPRTVATVQTGVDGRVQLERLVPDTTYVLQFDSAAAILVAGRRVGARPIQFQEDQNAGRELTAPDDVPGFPLHVGDQADATVRFVIGGTFAAGDRVAAVPMIDLAATDDAPVRPINPLTGAELTPLEARTFHAVVGQPWGVVPALSDAASGAVVSMDAGPAVTAPQLPAARPLSQRGAAALGGLFVALSASLLGLVGILLVQLRRRPQ